MGLIFLSPVSHPSNGVCFNDSHFSKYSNSITFHSRNSLWHADVSTVCIMGCWYSVNQRSKYQLRSLLLPAAVYFPEVKGHQRPFHLVSGVSCRFL